MRHHHDEYLRKIPLFAGLSDHDLEHVRSAATELDLAAGSVLMHEGTTGHEMVVVLDGTLEVLRHGEHVADTGPGGFAGEMALLSHRQRNSTVVAKTDVRVLHIDGRAFRALLDDVPQLAVKMLPVIASRVSAEHD